ncbi:MAG: hypothetical protein MJY94_09470 [Bacteroidales bacterium]|nr:hypothetical protein [Bacteroidales bacterium]
MKKIAIAFAALIAAFGISSCNKEQIETPSTDININISVANPTGTDTKAVKTNWVAGDKIFIWFDSSVATNPELTITFNGSTWEAGELASGVSENLQAEGSMKYFYLSTNTWDISDHTNFGSFHIFRFPSSNYSGDVANAATPLTLCSHINGQAEPTYTFAAGTLSLNLDKWKFLTNTQVTVPVPDANNADKYRLSFRKEGYSANAVVDVRLFDSYLDKGESTSTYARGGVATDGAVFYLRASSSFYTSSDNITFTLVDMTSGSKKTYTYSTPTQKVFPLSNHITIDKITGSGGCSENAFSAIKLPAFTGAEDSNWELQ